jgi:hypothetical protein
MKEDVLEQIVDDYLQFNGYFTVHNVSFWPRKDHPDYIGEQDSVSSDVDVVGYRPRNAEGERVVVVSCKAWQAGFDATAKLAELRGERRGPKRPTWKPFRDLWAVCGFARLDSCGSRRASGRSATPVPTSARAPCDRSA